MTVPKNKLMEEKHPDPGWLAHLVALQDGRIASDGGEQPKRAGFKAVKRGRMMKRISTIPELRTTRANEVRKSVSTRYTSG